MKTPAKKPKLAKEERLTPASQRSLLMDLEEMNESPVVAKSSPLVSSRTLSIEDNFSLCGNDVRLLRENVEFVPVLFIMLKFDFVDEI